MNSEKRKGFFAYASSPASIGECIERAITLINNSEVVHLKSWTKLRVSGQLIISPILKAIDEADFFCADLTGLNDNVLFELGYAIAIRRPLHLIIDTSFIDSNKRFKEFGLLTPVGYSSYSNGEEIVTNFFKEEPYRQDSRLLDTLIETIDKTSDRKAVLVLNSQVDSEYNRAIDNQTEYHKLPTIVDDASESKTQSLSWYMQSLHKVSALLAQFSSTSREGYQLHNAKCALVSGLALGLGLNVKMVAEKPYETPIDYRELLSKFSNREECAEIVNAFCELLKKDVAHLLAKKEWDKSLRKKLSELQKLSFGEAIAEHESEKIYDYYVETGHIQNLIKNEYNIIIGRKGSGKTATFYFIEEHLLQDARNHVCLIKPINFEVDGLISLMEKSNSEFEKGYLIECIWKFLIYSEVAKMFYEEIKDKELYAVTEDENEFLVYIEESSDVFLSDFSTRIEVLLQNLDEQQISDIGEGKNQAFRIKVSEILHQATLTKMREHFAKIIPRNHNIIILIDNLDKSWRRDAKVNILSRYILGLLGVCGRIVKDLSVVKSMKTNLSFRLTLFLRSDIFRYVRQQAREPDKLEVTKLIWTDAAALFRIIEERFLKLSAEEYVASDLWEQFVDKEVGGIDVKSYIMASIIPRPRDLIYLMKGAKDIAVSRGHQQIKGEDIEAARLDYSTWLFTSTIVENGITIKQMESFMLEMIGSSIIVSEAQISERMKSAGIDNSDDQAVEKFIDHLVDLAIIGREIKKDQFEYEYDLDFSKKLKVLSKKLGTKQYKIHNALVPFLECD